MMIQEKLENIARVRGKQGPCWVLSYKQKGEVQAQRFYDDIYGSRERALHMALSTKLHEDKRRRKEFWKDNPLRAYIGFRKDRGHWYVVWTPSGSSKQKWKSFNVDREKAEEFLWSLRAN